MSSEEDSVYSVSTVIHYRDDPATFLFIERNGQIDSFYREPRDGEDNSFAASLSWVREELERAYEYGLADGKCSQYVCFRRPEFDMILSMGIIDDIKKWVADGCPFVPDKDGIMTIGRTDGKV